MSTANANLNVSQAVKDLIKNYEGNVILVADNLAKEPHPTVGWGHYNDSTIKPGDVITLAQAEAYFNADIAKFESFVRSTATVTLTQNQFDALVMFAFNTGGQPNSKMWQAINSGNFEQAKYEWAEFRETVGERSEGLVSRRNDEIQLFESGNATRHYNKNDRVELYKDLIASGISPARAAELANETLSKSFENCFPAGTLITLWDGRQKPIESISTSDRVLAFDTEGNLAPRRVVRLFENVTDHFIRLEFGGGRPAMHVTEGHAFLTAQGEFLPIGQMIQNGAVSLVLHDGSITHASASRIVWSETTAHLFEAAYATAALGNLALMPQALNGWRTYNFEVEELHTYIANDVRVHNLSTTVLSTGEDYKNNMLLELLEDLGIRDEKEAELTLVKDGDKIVAVMIDEKATATVNNTSYLLTDVLDALSDAATAASKFISDLAQSGTAWFTQGGAQDAFASWLSQNIGAILSGDLSGTQALVSLGKYFSATFLSNYIVNDTLSAQTAITKVLYEQFGVGENPFDANGNIIDFKAESVVYAGDIAAGLTTIVATFITNGFDAEKALNAGVAIVAGRVAASYLTMNGYLGKGYSGEITTAVATVVAGLLNDFSGDWAQLGIQVGIAVAIYSVTQGVTTALAATQVGAALQSFPILGVDPLTIVAGLIVSFIASKIISSIYKGVVFHEGEFGDPQQLLNSIYQIRPIVVNGQTVNALVAVHPQGSTIIAQNIAYILGGAGSDVLVGNDSAGTISASGGADYLEARGGNDVLLGGDGNDHLNGGEGDDILQGDAGDDNLFGEAGIDTIIGGVGNDFIHAGSGDDIAAGGDGNDYILAGGGSDAISGDAGHDTIDGGYGDDSIVAGQGNDLVLGNLGNDIINGDLGNDTLFGSEGNDQIYGGEGNDFIDGGAGVDMLYGDVGNDIIIGGDDDDFADGGLGNDNILGGTGNDVILGGLDSDYLAGDAGNDSLVGGFGNDILVGGVGVDTLDGGDGNDVFIVSADTNDHNNIIVDIGSTSTTDTLLLLWLSQANALANLTLLQDVNDLVISYSGRVLATVTDQFAASGNGIERIELSNGDFINLSSVTYHATSHLGSFSVAASDTISVAAMVAERETSFNENLLSQNLYWNDTFLDKLSQLAYNEQLSDQTVYTYYDGTEIESFKRARSKFGGYYNVYKLDQAGNIDGTEFTRLEYAILDSEDQSAAASFGNNETLLAGPYESFINGATIVYSSFGGKNIQDIVVNGTVISTKVAGDNTLYNAGVTINGATYAQRFTAGTKTTSDIAVKKQGGDLLVGAYWNETINGKSGDDVLVGNVGDDSIIGGDGNDWGFGGDGNDTITGGNGDDVLFGDAGNDIIGGGDNNDAIIGGDGNDIITGDAGDDWIDGGEGADYVASGDGDDVILGGAGNDILFGNTGNDVIQGGDGNDSLDGGDGNDTLIGGNGQDTLNGGADDDRVVFENADGDVTFNFATGTYQIGSSGSAQIASIEQITASANDDLIYSGAGANLIDGGAGIDTVSYAYSTSGVTVNLATGQIYGGYAQGDVLRNIENVMGSAYNDYLVVDARVSLYGTLFERTTALGNVYIKNALMGLGGDDVIIGGRGADFIDGGDGNDQVSYSGSSDAVYIDLQNSIFSGGDALGDYLTNVENIVGTWQHDTIIGNAAANIIQTGGGNDVIEGGAGNDTIAAGFGADSINGGAGVDLVTFFGSTAVYANLTTGVFSGGDASGDVITNVENIEGTDYNDTLIGDANNNLLSGGVGNDRLEGNGGHDVIYSWTGNDTVLAGAGNDFVLGDDGDDSIESGAGYDTLFGGTGNDIIRGGDDDDFMIGDTGQDSLYGDAGQDSIFGYDGDDYIEGGEGNDVLAGEIGADTIYGGDGDDIIYSDIVFSPVPVAFGNDSVDAGAGNDLIRTGGGNDTINGGTGNDSIYGDDGDDVITDLTGDNLINAGAGNDSITGGDGKDAILGYAGNDTIDGGANDDQLYGLSGNDSIIAGVGNDTVYGDSGDDIIQGNAGTDFLDGWTGNDTIDGGADNDIIAGGDGADSLNGGDGNDVIYGDRQVDPNALPSGESAILAMIDNKPAAYDTWGLLYQGTNYNLTQLQSASHDMIIINPAELTVTGTPSSENLWEAADIASIKSSGDGKLVLGYVNTAKINSFWTQWDDAWTHNGVANGTLTDAGKAIGWLGDLDGGFIATREVDYTHAGWKSVVFERIGTMIDQGFNGTLLDDVLLYYTHNVKFDAQGNPATQKDYDTIQSNAVAMRDFVIAIRNFADAKMIADGKIVNDDTRFKLYVNGAPYILQDALKTESLSTVLADSASQTYLNAIDGIVVENFFSRGLTKFINDTKALYGNDTYNIALLSLDTDQVTEQQRLQTITAAVNAGFLPYTTENSLYDTLNNPFLTELANATAGSAGNDTINGGVGNDTMIGGAGDDTYYVDAAGDVITENASEGTDTVISSLTYTLGVNLENLTLSGTTAINGIGNALNNVITGNSGNNVLNGSTGNDTMIGGAGDDTYYVDAAGDVITENASEGTDTVNSTVTYTLSANLENLTITGSSAINGTGNTLNNILTGNSGNNVLNGSTGNDTMIGGAGDDTYYVDATGDVITENTSEGTDLVNSSVTYTLTANIENLTLTGTSAINGTGNILNNILTGNTANNILTSGDGNDTLSASDGNDTLYGGTGNDLLIGGLGSDYIDGGDGIDTVSYVNSTSFVSIDLATNNHWSGEASWDNIVNVENVIGSNHNDWIVGNSGANALTSGLGIDTLMGGLGNDTLDGGAGDDQLVGGDGDDLLIGGAGSDYIDGGAGIDTVSYVGSSNWVNVDLANNNQWNGDAAWDNIINVENVIGSAYDDFINGTTAANVLGGDAGNDTLQGGDGNDTLYGGTGNDLLIGGLGSDYIDGGDGIDTVSYVNSNTFVSIDLATNNHWSGEASWDNIVNVENVIGSNHNDWIVGNSGANALTGGLGIDTLTGGLGNDTLDGGAGDDQLVGGDGDDLLIGGAGSDYIDGGAGIDTVSYVGSSNWVNVDLANNNQWNGDASWDSITNVENVIGSSYSDQITGNSGSNFINGGTGADTLYGLGGNDTIYGDEDGDIIIGGAGKDVLYGGTGADVFKILALSDSATGNADTIMDFAQGVDKIDVSGLGFTGIQSTATPTASKLGTYVDSGWTHLTDGNGFDIAILGSHNLTQADLINT